MLILPGTEEMGSVGRRRRPTRREELRRRRRRPIVWPSRRDEPFFRDAFVGRLKQSAATRVLLQNFGVMFLTSIGVVICFCLSLFWGSVGLLLNFWNLFWISLPLVLLFWAHACKGQNCCRIFDEMVDVAVWGLRRWADVAMAVGCATMLMFWGNFVIEISNLHV